MSTRPSHTRPRFVVSAVALAAAVITTVLTAAQPGDRSMLQDLPDPHPNFDIRAFKQDPRIAVDPAVGVFLARVQAPDGARAALAADRFAGQAALQGAFDGLVIEDHPGLGTMEIVSAAAGKGFLTPASGDRAGSLRAFLGAHSSAYGLTVAQVGDLVTVADYMNPAGNMGFAEFEQRFHGIPVFQGLVRGGFTAKGELVRTTGVLATGIDPATLATTPAISPARAVMLAAGTVGVSVAEEQLVEKANASGRVTLARASLADDSKAWLVYFPIAPGVARLAWATEIWGSPDSFLTVVDAETGTMLFRKNMTSYQTQSATYHVYASDSPAPSSPTTATPDNNFQAPFVARQPFTLIGNEAPYTFNNLGWITDGANTTAGNNVIAGIDRDGTNGVDAPVTGTARVFNFAYNPETDSPLTVNYQNGDVTNMFYWVNRYHDLTYVLGFTEQARNFQNDNFGRGGAAADRVSAEGQDSSGTNNANFATPPDGGAGRMQMFIWTGPNPDRSGDLDQDVIFHELTHGLSNRLHGNASGLTTNMAGGMGEGWSDFYARALLADPGDNPNGVYTVGGWATREITAGFLANYYYGIRRFPYAPRAATGGPSNRPFSPLTFGDIDSTQANLTDGAYPRGPVGSTQFDQVHNIGEVWAGMLWEVRTRFVNRLGFSGNQRFLQYVTDGMKLDPVGPTMLQARDAILAAATAGGATPADIADIWQGFATRGMGVLAQITNAGSGADTTRVVESYLTPSDPVPTFTINDVTLAEGNAGSTNAVFTVTLSGGGATESRVSFATADGTATRPVGTTFTNAAAITINDNAASTPYPATVNVAGQTGTVTNVAVRLNGLSHTFPGDVDALLVGPGGQQSLFMSDVGAGTDVTAIDVTFQDGGPAAPVPGPLATGTYAPTNNDTTTDAMPAPAPAPSGASYNSPLAVFNGTNPNGTWSLYLRDDVGIDIGAVAGGFSVIITTTTSPGDYTSQLGQLVFPPATTTQTIVVPIAGDAVPEPNETFLVNLSSPINAVIGDNQAVGTIVNDDGGGPLPTAASDAYGTPLNTPLVIAAPGVLGNDNANGGGALTAALGSGPAHGSVALSANGGFTYTPVSGYTGPDSFTYVALNTFGSSSATTVSLTVGIVLPTTVNDALSTTYPAALNLAAPGVLANDSANGGGALSAVLVTNVSNGTLALGAGGSVSYTPNFGFVGNDSFTYRAVSPAGNGNVATVTITVAPPTTVQPPYNFRVDSVVGNLVTLRWDALPIGPQASTFVLEGGVMPGQVMASIPTGSPSPIFTFVAPTGSWSIRMHGQLGSDKSPASNEAALHVNVPVTPSAPRSLLGLVNGTTLDLAWKNTFEGGPPSAMVLDVTGSATVSLPMGPTERFSFNPVPGGSYTFRMRQINAGGSSPASAPVSLSFPAGCTAPPEVPANFLGYRVGSTAFVIWDPPATGAAPTSYLLDVSGSFVGTFPTAGRSLSGAVSSGSYQVRVQAVNACGASAFTATQVISVP